METLVHEQTPIVEDSEDPYHQRQNCPPGPLVLSQSRLPPSTLLQVCETRLPHLEDLVDN